MGEYWGCFYASLPSDYAEQINTTKNTRARLSDPRVIARFKEMAAEHNIKVTGLD